MTTDTLLREPFLNTDTEDQSDAGLAFQSEFPQVKLPFQISIGGLNLEGISISLTKALVSGRLPRDLEYQDELVSLRFDFDGFSVTLFADAILSQDTNDPSAPISVFFTHPTDGHLSPLRYLINSFIAGDTVTLGQLLSTGAAPSQLRPNPPKNVPRRIQVSMRVVALAGLGLLFGMVASDLVYQRLILSYEPRPLVISSSDQMLRATAAGQITFLNPGAAEGDIAFTLVSNRGEFFSLRMPCACESTIAGGLFEGATVLSGDPVLALQSESQPVVQADLSQAGLARFFRGDQAEVVTPEGRIQPVRLRLDTSTARPLATVVFPENAKPLVTGQIARLRFNKMNGRVSRYLKSRLAEIAPLFTIRN